jgi:hypothetical protein
MKKLTTLLVGAVVALLALAPVAGAKTKRHRTVTVCGIVDMTSTLPTTLVIGTGGTHKVTIQNSKPVTVPAGVVVGADVCARAKRVRNADATKTNVLLKVKVRPAATVVATGPVTLGTGKITVATLDFIFQPGFTLSPRITDQKVVRAWGSAATAGGDLLLKRVHRVRVGHARVKPHPAKMVKPGSAIIAGRVSDLSPATATDPGSLAVGGITLVIPAGKVLRPKVKDGARVIAWAVVKDGALTLRRVVVTQRAVA